MNSRTSGRVSRIKRLLMHDGRKGSGGPMMRGTKLASLLRARNSLPVSSKKDGKLIKSGRWVLRCVYLAISARGSKNFSPTTFPQISVTQNVFNLRRFVLCLKHFCDKNCVSDETRLSLDPVLKSALCSVPCQLSQMNTRFSHLDVHVY